MNSPLGLKYLYLRNGIYYLRYRLHFSPSEREINISLRTKDKNFAMRERDRAVLFDLQHLSSENVTKALASRLIENDKAAATAVRSLPDDIQERLGNKTLSTDAHQSFIQFKLQDNRCDTRRAETIDSFLKQFFGYVTVKYINDITSGECLSFAEKYRTCKGARGTRPDINVFTEDKKLRVSPSTVRANFTLMNTFFRWCIKKQYIFRNPFSSVDIPRKERNSRKSPPVELVDALCATAFPVRSKIDRFEWSLMPLMARYTGARMGEIASLMADDIVFIHGMYCINMPQGKAEQLGIPKGSKRPVPVHSKLQNALLQHVNRRSGGRLFLTLGDRTRTYHGKPITTTAKVFNKLWNESAKSILNSMSFHCWRSYAITRMDHSGFKAISPFVVGHDKNDVHNNYVSLGNITKEELEIRRNAVESII